MADRDEEFIAVLYSCLEARTKPCTIDALCKAEPGFHNKTDQIRSALQKMCANTIVIQVNGDEYILPDKLKTLPDPQPVSKFTSLDTDGDSQSEVPAMVSGSSIDALPLSREPVALSNQNTQMMKAENNVEPITDSINGLQISHRNSWGQAVAPQQAMVSTSSSQTVDSRNMEYKRQCESIIQLLKQSDRPIAAKDIAQRTNIGMARADVNRVLYFLGNKDVLCKTEDKTPCWKFIRDASEGDLEIFGAELAKIPDSKRSKNTRTRNPTSVQPSTDDECHCPNAGPGCKHYHIHQHHKNYNIQVGNNNQMNTAIGRPPALNPPDYDQQ